MTVALDPQGRIDSEALDSVLAAGVAAFVLSNPHNPTGHVATREELALLAERCAAAETWVLADEIHAPLVLPVAEHIPWLEVSDAAREYGIALTSASKAFNLAALKTAFMPSVCRLTAATTATPYSAATATTSSSAATARTC